MRNAMVGAMMIMALGAAPGWAQAQAGNTAGLVDLPGVAPKETSPLRRMARASREWIAAEKARQAKAPTPLIETVVELEEQFGDDIIKVAKRERIDTHDLIMVTLFDITSGASESLAGELRALERRGAPAAEIEPVAARKAQVDEDLAEVLRGQSVAARRLSGNL